MTDPISGASAHLTLSRRQIWVTAAIGAALWLLAALLLRALAPYGIYDGVGRVVLYALIVPGTYPFVRMTQRLAGLAPDQIAIGAAVATAVATLLDGVALAWFPALYGDGPEAIAGAGAAILWGAGVGLVIGFWLNRRV